MSWLDGVTTEANLFRMSGDGRRVYAPVGARGPLFLVSEASAGRPQRDVRSFFRWGMPVVVLLAVTAERLWGWTMVIAVGVIATLALQSWLARGLPLAQLRPGDLQRVDRRTRILASAQATGRCALRRMLLGACIMAGIGLVGGLLLQEPAGWLVAALMVTCAGFFAWQISLLNR